MEHKQEQALIARDIAFKIAGHPWPLTTKGLLTWDNLTGGLGDAPAFGHPLRRLPRPAVLGPRPDVVLGNRPGNGF